MRGVFATYRIDTGNVLTLLVCLVSVVAFCGGCDNRYDGVQERGMYYWSTTFELDSVKVDFLKQHGVNKLYVRYFDVTPGSDGLPVPNASISFAVDSLCSPGQHLPDGLQIVPVVYILNDCMGRKSDMSDSELAQKLLARVLQMSETHGMGAVKEIQIDCDWTGSTRQRFFDFLTELRNIAQPEGIEISATIRLHQLSQPVPPVDKGVLMVYNTGDMTDIKDEKPILDPNVVKKYARYLKDYKLPLGAAYPIYKWDLLFRNGKFVDISHYEGELPMVSGDTLVSRVPTVEDVVSSKAMIESMRPDCKRETILFDLNNYNINRYSHEQVESFFD